MKHIIILLILMSWLGSGLAQQKDTAGRDTGSQPAFLPAKTPPKPESTTVKKDSNALRKSGSTASKDTGKKAATKRLDTNKVVTSEKSADTSKAAAGSQRADNNDNFTGRDSKVATQTQASVPSQTPQKKTNPLMLKMAAAAIAKGNTDLDPAIYFPKNMNGVWSDEHSIGTVQLHQQSHQDYLFYSFLGITLLLAITKISFPKYFNQIFWFFLHPNERKKSFSDQMNGQNLIPAFLLNLFFALTGGLFLTQIFHPVWTGGNFWKNWIIFSLVLMVVYLIKFLIIKLSGWLFNSPIAAGTYNNVVFSINKVIGLLLLPITLLIAYGGPRSVSTAISIATIFISILLIYRYIASFLMIKGKLRVNAFHFILYLCAVEIIPLLLAYKVLFSNIDQLI